MTILINIGGLIIMKLEIEEIAIEEIIPYENNAKKHPKEQIKQIAKSIEDFGFNDPIAICQGVIVEGHGRLLAAKLLNIPTVPVIRLDHLTERQRRAYTLAHNQTTLSTGFDLEMLKVEIESIDMDLSAYGFDMTDTLDFNEAKDDEYDVVPSKEPRVKMGEIWQMGEHRLMCGDSTDMKTVELLMNGNLADLCITDPPYNVDYEGKAGNNLTIKNDNMSDDKFLAFLESAFECINASLKPGAAYYIWHADSEGYNFRKAARNIGKVRQCLIWNKTGMVMGRQDYQWKHEPILYGWKDGGSHYFTASRTNTTVIDDKELAKLKKADLIDMNKNILKGITSTVIDFPKPARSAEHPTMKPVEIQGYLIKNSTKPGDIVLDTFGGAGSALIACEQLNRKCYMMELDETYATVILDRWEKLTGEVALKVI